MKEVEEDRTRLGLTRQDRACLVLDGHPSHFGPAFLETLVHFNIVLYALPSHTSQCTQPLDLVTFGILKTELRAELKSHFKKEFPADLSDAAAVRCSALQAALDSLETATHKKKVKAAFRRAGVIVHDNKIIFDPMKVCEHLPNSDVVFNEPIEPCDRVSLYSCVINTPELLAQFKVAKDPDAEKTDVKEAWQQIAAIRDALTREEKKLYFENPDTLPWSGNPLIGKDPNLAFVVKKTKRRSITTKDEKHWSQRLLQIKKDEIAEKKSKFVL